MPRGEEFLQRLWVNGLEIAGFLGAMQRVVKDKACSKTNGHMRRPSYGGLTKGWRFRLMILRSEIHRRVHQLHQLGAKVGLKLRCQQILNEYYKSLMSLCLLANVVINIVRNKMYSSRKRFWAFLIWKYTHPPCSFTVVYTAHANQFCNCLNLSWLYIE